MLLPRPLSAFRNFIIRLPVACDVSSPSHVHNTAVIAFIIITIIVIVVIIIIIITRLQCWLDMCAGTTVSYEDKTSFAYTFHFLSPRRPMRVISRFRWRAKHFSSLLIGPVSFLRQPRYLARICKKGAIAARIRYAKRFRRSYLLSNGKPLKSIRGTGPYQLPGTC